MKHKEELNLPFAKLPKALNRFWAISLTIAALVFVVVVVLIEFGFLNGFGLEPTSVAFVVAGIFVLVPASLFSEWYWGSMRRQNNPSITHGQIGQFVDPANFDGDGGE
jgi:hypothetical protein